MNGLGGGGFGGNGTMAFNQTKNATPEDEESLAKILRGIQTPSNSAYTSDGTQTSGKPDLSWFFSAIQGSQPNGLPTGTQRSPTANDSLYTINQVGSRLLGYPQEAVFNAPRPKGLLG